MALTGIRTLLLLLIFLLTFCGDEEELTSTSLVGKWQLVQQKVGIGPPGEWVDISGGQIYEFKTDGTFTISEHHLCTTGEYEMKNDSLVLKNDCLEDSTERIFSIEMHSSHFTISPIYPAMCTEGCFYRYEKRE